MTHEGCTLDSMLQIGTSKLGEYLGIRGVKPGRTGNAYPPTDKETEVVREGKIGEGNIQLEQSLLGVGILLGRRLNNLDNDHAPLW